MTFPLVCAATLTWSAVSPQAFGADAKPGLSEFVRDARELWKGGRGSDSQRWPAPKPLLAADLSNAEFPEGAWKWEADVLVGYGIPGWKGGKGNLWTRESYGNFVLNVDFKCVEKGNSGVFIRVGDVEEWLETSTEVQILEGTHDNPTYLTGALFDSAAPSRRPKIEAGTWHTLVVIARGARISVFLDTELVTDVSLDDWKEPGKNPDGTKNRFKRALKDRPREGRIGLQYHGQRIEFRHLLIEPL